MCIFIKKETPTQLFSCELCNIFKNIFLSKYLRETTSAHGNVVVQTWFLKVAVL